MLLSDDCIESRYFPCCLSGMRSVYPGLACLGYLNTKFREKGKNKIIPDPERFDKVEQVLRRLLTGNYSVAEVISFAENELQLRAPALGKRPERPLSRSGWYRFFANPLPSGWYEYPKGSGNWIKGNHQAMISLEEFECIQVLLGENGKPRGTKQQHVYRGLIQCGSCPAAVTAEHKTKRQKNGTTHCYTYYHCTKRIAPNCPERSIEIMELETQIADTLSRLSISSEFHKWARIVLAMFGDKDAQFARDNIENNWRVLARVEQQLDALKLKFTSPENVSGELLSNQEYLDLKQAFQKRQEIIQQRVKVPDKVSMGTVNERTQEAFDLAHHAHAHFVKGGEDAKRDILRRVGSNRMLKDKILLITLREPLDTIARKRAAVEREISRVRTAKNVDDKGYNAEFVSHCPTLRGVVDEVRTYCMAADDQYNTSGLPGIIDK